MRAPARQSVSKATLALPPEGTARFALVSDTHSKLHPRLLEQLAALAPRAILHAGDVGALGVLEELATVAPVHAVRGNIDGQTPELPDVLVLELARGNTTVLRALLLHIALSGLGLRADVARRARSLGARLVLCGHSHVPFLKREGELTVCNPGSVGPRRFRLPIVYAVLTLEGASLRIEHIDAETGLPWRPTAA